MGGEQQHGGSYSRTEVVAGSRWTATGTELFLRRCSIGPGSAAVKTVPADCADMSIALQPSNETWQPRSLRRDRSRHTDNHFQFPIMIDCQSLILFPNLMKVGEPSISADIPIWEVKSPQIEGHSLKIYILFGAKSMFGSIYWSWNYLLARPTWCSPCLCSEIHKLFLILPLSTKFQFYKKRKSYASIYSFFCSLQTNVSSRKSTVRDLQIPITISWYPSEDINLR